jgi:hypothetical protein
MKLRAWQQPESKRPPLKVVLDREQRMVWARRRPHWSDTLKGAA